MLHIFLKRILCICFSLKIGYVRLSFPVRRPHVCFTFPTVSEETGRRGVAIRESCGAVLRAEGHHRGGGLRGAAVQHSSLLPGTSPDLQEAVENQDVPPFVWE